MNSKKPGVTVEDLIRIKRAERPQPEFWSQFEREMRMRQLAAIVEPRPWWAPFIRVSARVSRYQVPIGAAAVLALTFVTVREYRTVDFAPTFIPEITAPALESRPLAELPQSNELSTADYLTPEMVRAEAPAPAAVASVEVSTGRSSHSVPLLDVAKAPSEPSPSARYIAANLAAAQAADPRILDEVFGPSVGSHQTREPVRDPLSQISSPGESRRARLLTTALPLVGSGNDVSVGTSDRVARHLTEERLYDSISRVGVRGDRVAIKF